MPENWLEKQLENERRIRKDLSPSLLAAIGGNTGRDLVLSLDFADAKSKAEVPSR